MNRVESVRLAREAQRILLGDPGDAHRGDYTERMRIGLVHEALKIVHLAKSEAERVRAWSGVAAVALDELEASELP